ARTSSHALGGDPKLRFGPARFSTRSPYKRSKTMMSTRIWINLTLLVGTPVFAAAQESTQTPPSQSGVAETRTQGPIETQRGTTVAPSQSPMYEDIEIMRRLLHRELQNYAQASCSSCHAAVRGSTFSPARSSLPWQRNASGSATGSRAGAWTHPP